MPHGIHTTGHSRVDPPAPWIRQLRSRGQRIAPWLPGVLGIGGVLLVLAGLLLFAHIQTQAMFRDSLLYGVAPGTAPRSDGGILFSAFVTSTGVAALLWAVSRRPWQKRLLPTTGIVATGTVILAAHFTIFVNGILLPDNGRLHVVASFLFHDAAALPIAVFSLALITLVIIALGLISVLALLTPQMLHDRILQPSTLDDHRARALLLSLALVAAAGTFARQFFQYALDADANPTGGFVTTNLIVVYYVLSFLVLFATVLAIWRTASLTWGDLRLRSGKVFQRNHRNLLRVETWTWAGILLLNLIVLLTEPIHNPSPSETSRVFIVDSRGAAMFFLFVPIIYILQRKASQSLCRHLQKHRVNIRGIGWDRLLTLAILLALVWIVTPFILPDNQNPLLYHMARTGLATLVLLSFSLRLDAMSSTILTARERYSPILLFSSFILAVLTGIMLWGTGNSVVTEYARGAGGFITPEGRFLQPYAVLFRLLGSAFIAIPPLVGLWLLAWRHKRNANPGHLVLVTVGLIVAMNLLFTIQPSDPFDPAIGQTDVRIGFYFLQFATVFDTIVMSLLWATATGLALMAATRIILRVNSMPLFPKRKTTHSN